MESKITRLFYAEVNNVIWGLERMKPGDSLVKEEIRKLIGYLHNNRERIHYQGDRKIINYAGSADQNMAPLMFSIF